MFEQPFVAFVFIRLALKVSGFIVRDELQLRCLLAAGMLFDLTFYALQSPAIWGSVLANAMIIDINMVLIVVIAIERSTWFMTDKQRTAFEYFKILSPGQFRLMNRRAIWKTAEDDTVLLREGERSNKLFLLETDAFVVSKHGQDYPTSGPAFAGEIMLFQGATATVTIPKGTVDAEWFIEDLRRAMQKSQALENALVARFGHDLADKVRKVRNSAPLPPDSVCVAGVLAAARKTC